MRAMSRKVRIRHVIMVMEWRLIVCLVFDTLRGMIVEALAHNSRKHGIEVLCVPLLCVAWCICRYVRRKDTLDINLLRKDARMDWAGICAIHWIRPCFTPFMLFVVCEILLLLSYRGHDTKSQTKSTCLDE